MGEIEMLLEDLEISVPYNGTKILQARPGDRSRFQPEIAGNFEFARREERARRLSDHVYIRPAHRTDIPYCREEIELAPDAVENILARPLWFRFYPDKVPVVGRILWQKLVDEGRVSADTKVFAVDVETEEFRAFNDMSTALDWTNKFPRPTIYFRTFHRRSWLRMAGGANER